MPVTIHCTTCDSEDIRRDAYAAWNVENQEWEIVTLFDNADCETCGGETSLTERFLPAGNAWDEAV